MNYRIPYADDEYLRRLGRFVYSVGYLEWAVLGSMYRFEPLPAEITVRTLAGLSLGEIARRLTSAEIMSSVADPEGRAWLETAGDIFKDVSGRRNGVIHSNPATIEGRQRLTRWNPDKDETFVVTDDLLDELIGRVEAALDDIGDPPKGTGT